MVPLPLQGRFGHLRCPQRRPAGGEAKAGRRRFPCRAERGRGRSRRRGAESEWSNIPSWAPGAHPLAVVLTSSISFASSQARKLIRSAARPLPTEIASLDFGGAPLRPVSLQQAALRLSGGALAKARESADFLPFEFIRPCRPFHHALRAWSPFPYRDGSGTCGALSAALRAARLHPTRCEHPVPVPYQLSALDSPPKAALRAALRPELPLQGGGDHRLRRW